MRILHVCLSNFYVDNYNYQENVLPLINKKDGHEVMIIASCFTYVDNIKLGYVEPREYYTKDGIKIVRVMHRIFGYNLMSRRIKSYPGIYRLIEAFKPDVILFHGCHGWELLTVSRYKKNHPNIKLYVDSHAEKGNSAKGWLSQNVLHKIFYRSIIKRCEKYIDKFFYISMESGDFLKEMYGIDDAKTEFYSLGGIVYDKEKATDARKEVRKQLNIPDENLMIVQAGKMTLGKKLLETIRCISRIKYECVTFVIVGSLSETIKVQILNMIYGDKRIKYLGWKSVDELMRLLMAADLYVQPGTCSVTAQNAICCGCPVILSSRYEGYHLFVQDNGWLVNTEDELYRALQEFVDCKNQLTDMKIASYKIARKYLDYSKLAARLYR
ncbi:glycosyltransferase family 4 protein [Phascolarctobacterium faecium]|uniref:glycosyltransferase family 4 protein n=1 Tax=Phascolarctobacterium faecium TaxID=33025 RepID=UPI002674D3EC|nr:glycosyltransferase family 4 protein [Phascolarctobacterium faecium]